MTLDQARRDYQNDAMFHAVVDCIANWILKADVTPAEARMAAMLAAIHVEEMRTRPAFFIPQKADGIAMGSDRAPDRL